MISAYTSVAEFVRQMKKAGSISQFFNVSFVGSKALAEALGKEGYGVMISQVVPFPWSPLTPIVKEYLDLAKTAGNVDVNFSSLEGFIAAKVLVEGLRRTGKDLTREKFIAAMESMSNLEIGGFLVRFAPGQPQRVAVRRPVDDRPRRQVHSLAIATAAAARVREARSARVAAYSAGRARLDKASGRAADATGKQNARASGRYHCECAILALRVSWCPGRDSNPHSVATART